MIIKNIHIKGFGKFKDLSIDYQKDINTLLEDNGYGKTTIIDFLFSMFYGIGGAKASDKTNPTLRRNKYAPWDSDSFGGSLEFNYKGKDYILERSFSSKSKTDDTVSLKELPSLIDSKDFDLTILGEQLFGLDEEGFKDTLYVSQIKDKPESFSSTVTGSLSAILGDASLDESTIEIYIDKLQKSIKERFTSKTTGEIPLLIYKIKNTKESISALKKDEYRIDEIKHQNDKLKEDLDKLEIKKSNIKEKMKECNRLANSRALKEQYNQLLQKINDEKEELNRLSKFSNDDAYKNVNDYYNEYKLLNNNYLPTSVKPSISEDIVRDFSEAKRLMSLLGSEPKKGLNIFGLISTISAVVLIIVGSLLSFLLSAYFMIMVGVGLVLLVVGFLLIMLKNQNNTNNKQADIKAELRIIYRKYNLSTDNYFESLTYLNSLFEKYNNSVNEINKALQAQETYQSKINELTHLLNDFALSYDLKGKVEEIAQLFNEKRNRYLLVESQLKQNEEELQNLKEKMGEDYEDVVVENYEDLEVSLSSVESEIHLIVEQISKNKEELRRINDSVNEAYELEEDLEIDEVHKQELESEKNIYDITLEFITQSVDESNEKYVLPIKNKVKDYLGLLGYDFDININKNIEFQTKDNGSYHGINYYSFGTKDLINFALRLAVIDAVYENKEKPIIFLDDPFSELDQDNLSSATKLVKELSKKYQVFYFTCHKSRIL